VNVIEVVDYDPSWPQQFADIRDKLWPAVAGIAIAIEHVGGTSVPGLASKPVIDVDIVVHAADIPRAVAGIAKLEYTSMGELGIPQREAFRAPNGSPRHNVYVTAQGCESLRNHLAVREYLRAHPDAAQRYGALKKRLANWVDGNMDCYVAGKSGFIAQILAENGFSSAEVDASRKQNALTPAQLLQLNGAQLDGLFAECETGPVPDGPARGVALIATQTVFAKLIAASIRAFVWKGKTFDAAQGRLVNRITPFGLNAVAARVYKSPSLFDRRPCIVLDYSRTSIIAHFIRDEIRMLAPNYYLGKVYFLKLPTFRFCLQF